MQHATSRSQRARHDTIKDIERISCQMVQTVQCCSARHHTPGLVTGPSGRSGLVTGPAGRSGLATGPAGQS